MKIVDITHFYASESGGVKTYIDQKIQFLKNKPNVEHVLILPADEDRLISNANCKKYFIKSPPIPFWKPYRLLINKHKINNIIDRENPEIVEVGSPIFLPKWLTKNKTYICIGFFHSNIEGSINSVIKASNKIDLSMLIRKYIKRTYSLFDLVIAPSKYIKNYLNRIGIDKTCTVYLGVDTNTFSLHGEKYPIRKTLGIPEDRTLLIYAGRLSNDKNIRELPEIYNLLLEHSDKFHLLIIGSGPEEKNLRKKLKRNTTFLGFISDKKTLASIYRSCDIFITPSRAESFGLAIIEAQSCGIPVIGYKKASLPEVTINPEFLVDNKNQFINILLYLHENKNKIDRKRISKKTTRKFSWRQTFEQILSIYSSLIEERSKHSK
ncbi:glycosyltransferase [Desulfurobacterium sp.]